MMIVALFLRLEYIVEEKNQYFLYLPTKYVQCADEHTILIISTNILIAFSFNMVLITGA